jgi:nucleotide-binding universal stress UspA family protein
MRIILVIDYSRRSERVVRELAERSWPSGTAVRVLAVVDNAPPSAAELLFDAGGSLETVMRLRKERSGKLADEAAAVLRAKGLTVETSVRAGRARRAIKEEAKQWPADLVIADRGLRRFSLRKSLAF